MITTPNTAASITVSRLSSLAPKISRPTTAPTATRPNSDMMGRTMRQPGHHQNDPDDGDDERHGDDGDTDDHPKRPPTERGEEVIPHPVSDGGDLPGGDGGDDDGHHRKKDRRPDPVQDGAGAPGPEHRITDRHVYAGYPSSHVDRPAPHGSPGLDRDVPEHRDHGRVVRIRRAADPRPICDGDVPKDHHDCVVDGPPDEQIPAHDHHVVPGLAGPDDRVFEHCDLLLAGRVVCTCDRGLARGYPARRREQPGQEKKDGQSQRDRLRSLMEPGTAVWRSGLTPAMLDLGHLNLPI